MNEPELTNSTTPRRTRFARFRSRSNEVNQEAASRNAHQTLAMCGKEKEYKGKGERGR